MSTSPHLKTLSLTLSHSIKPHQISRWRGALLEMVGWEEELFHNHKNEGYTGTGTYSSIAQRSKAHHYRYPLIQYYEQDRRGTILGINEGRDILLKMVAEKELTIKWDGKEQFLKIVDIQKNRHDFHMLSEPRLYRINQWMALTQKNHKVWEKADGLLDRIQLLERLLPNHLIGLFKTFQWNWPQRIETQLQQLYRAKPITFKGQKMQVFDMEFTANVDLPNGIAIGKGTSQGFGWLEQVHTSIPYQENRMRKRRIQ